MIYRNSKISKSVIVKLPGGHTYEKREYDDKLIIEFVDNVMQQPDEFNKLWGNVRVLNKRYWPYQVEVPGISDLPSLSHNDIGRRDPRARWCYENFKSANWRHTGYNPITFVFKRAEDATAFTLRWA